MVILGLLAGAAACGSSDPTPVAAPATSAASGSTSTTVAPPDPTVFDPRTDGTGGTDPNGASVSAPKGTSRADRLPPGPAKTFCTYAFTVDLSKVGNQQFTAGFQTVYDAIVNAIPVAPAQLTVALADLKEGLDLLKPAVDAGQVSSGDDFHRWFVAQDKRLQERMALAVKQIDLYASTHC